MSKEKTIITEISMACGIAGISIYSDVSGVIGNVSKLDIQIIRDGIEENNDLQTLSNTFYDLGLLLNRYLGIYEDDRIEWKPLKHDVGNGDPDIIIWQNDIPTVISVKENSHVISNRSPVSLLALANPAVLLDPSKHRHYDIYMFLAKKEYNSLFQQVKRFYLPFKDFSNVDEYYKKTTGKERKGHAKNIKYLFNKYEYLDIALAYAKLVSRVSDKFVELFNLGLNKRQECDKNVIQIIAKDVLRIPNKSKYIIIGTDKNERFALEINSIESLTEQISFADLRARSLGSVSHQPEVLLEFFLYNKEKKTEEMARVKVKIELRWSHGKFSGNPEAKVYKKFRYKDLPLGVPIIKE